MKKLQNTLFVTTQKSYLCHEGDSVLVRQEQETRLRLPIHTVSSIVCFGAVSVSPPLMGLCAERQVAISFLTEHGQFLARVQGPVSGNVLLRREQYRRADNPEACAEIARSVLVGKVANTGLAPAAAVIGLYADRVQPERRLANQAVRLAPGLDPAHRFFLRSTTLHKTGAIQRLFQLRLGRRPAGCACPPCSPPCRCALSARRPSSAA